MKLQNTDTTKRLNTESHTKNERAAQATATPLSSQAQKPRMHAMNTP